MIDRLVDKKNAPTPNLVFGGPSKIMVLMKLHTDRIYTLTGSLYHPEDSRKKTNIAPERFFMKTTQLL